MNEQKEVVSLDQFRTRKQEEKQRKTERLFFHHLVGIYSVVNPNKMVPIDIIDVSEEGLAVQVPYESQTVWTKDTNNIPVRLYFSAESFMEVIVDVKNSRPTIEGGVKYLRYGCAVQAEHRSYEAWKKFVSFLRVYADVSEKDSGNIGMGQL
jgi:hypothetical protein